MKLLKSIKYKQNNKNYLSFNYDIIEKNEERNINNNLNNNLNNILNNNVD